MIKIDNIKIQKSHPAFKANNSFANFNLPVLSQSKTNIQPTQDEFSGKKAEKSKLPIALGLAVGLSGLTFGIVKVIKGHSRGVKLESIKEDSQVALTYIETLAQGVSEMLGKKVEASQLASVVDKKELLQILPKLSEQNYVYNSQNVQSGLFSADMHSHSNYSDGKGEVKHILNQVSEYADKLYLKTKEKFIFSLTDHDGVEGVKEALGIIAENPEKFKNVRFIPGAELSYAHVADKSPNLTETSEVLAYCINPFSKGITNFLENIHKKRTDMVKSFVNDLSTKFPDDKFSLGELAQNYGLNLPHGTYAANLHWKVNHYGQTKYAISKIAKESGQNPEDLYKTIMIKTEEGKALGNLKDKGLIPNYMSENEEIIQLGKNYQPQVDSKGTVKASCENTFEEIISTFSSEKGSLLAFAHPFYMSERVNNTQKFFNELVEGSNGLIMATESYHQSYKPKIIKESQDIIKAINNHCESKGLLKVGGRDNHKEKLFG